MNNSGVKPHDDSGNLRKAVTDVKGRLEEAVQQMRAIIEDDLLMPETPIEVQMAMESAAGAIEKALVRLESIVPKRASSEVVPGGPTRQQGQFLAFIFEYITRNSQGIAPSHANLQRFFNLTAPSVNSMLIRLEQRGFIRREPGKARAIEVLIRPELIPQLERPFKY